MLRGAGAISFAFLGLLCAASSVGSGISGREEEGSGDAHTYYSDGRVVRNRPRHKQEDLQLSSHGLAAAAFKLLEVGQDAAAARAFAASARLSKNASPGCPAAFAAPGGVWVASQGGVHRPMCRRSTRAVNFFDGALSMEEAVKTYTAFHRAEMAGGINPEGRYVMYRPSFHGEGWGNRMMALAAVTALGVGTGTCPRLSINKLLSPDLRTARISLLFAARF